MRACSSDGWRWWLSGTVVASLWVQAAHGREILSTTVTAGAAAERDCYRGNEISGAGVVGKRLRLPSPGLVYARIESDEGDWDLALLDGSGTVVAAAAGFSSNEVAEGFAVRDDTLVVRACRISGSTAATRLTVHFLPLHQTRSEANAQLIRIATPHTYEKDLVNRLDLDLTEHGAPGFVDAVVQSDPAQLTGRLRAPSLHVNHDLERLRT